MPKHPNPKDGKTVVPNKEWIPDELFQAIQKSIPIPCVDIIILKKNNGGIIETLLIKRKIYPEIGKWCTVGGRILKNETTSEAIDRQAERELGIKVKILKPWGEKNPFAVYNNPTADKQKHFVELVLPVVIVSGTVSETGPEFSESKWFPLNKLPEPFGFHFKEVFEDFVTTELKYELQ